MKKFKFFKDNRGELLNAYDGVDFEPVRMYTALEVDETDHHLERFALYLSVEQVEQIMRHMVKCYYINNSSEQLINDWGTIMIYGLVSRPNNSYQTELHSNVSWCVNEEQPRIFELTVPANLFEFYAQDI